MLVIQEVLEMSLPQSIKIAWQHILLLMILFTAKKFENLSKNEKEGDIGKSNANCNHTMLLEWQKILPGQIFVKMVRQCDLVLCLNWIDGVSKHLFILR
jgi:hypothetical protein